MFLDCFIGKQPNSLIDDCRDSSGSWIEKKSTRASRRFLECRYIAVIQHLLTENGSKSLNLILITRSSAHQKTTHLQISGKRESQSGSGKLTTDQPGRWFQPVPSCQLPPIVLYKLDEKAFMLGYNAQHDYSFNTVKLIFLKANVY